MSEIKNSEIKNNVTRFLDGQVCDCARAFLLTGDYGHVVAWVFSLVLPVSDDPPDLGVRHEHALHLLAIRPQAAACAGRTSGRGGSRATASE